MGQDIHASVEQRLRRARQRYTSARRHLIDLLVQARRPLTIPEILGRGDDLTQSSTYRNLHVLEQAGAVRRLVTTAESGARFELAEDLTDHHHHLVCSSCGNIEDFHPSTRIERALEQLTSESSTGSGFATDHHRLDLVGTCASCR